MTAETLPLEEFGMQVCKTCKRKLPLSNFSPDKNARLGVRHYCKKCLSEKTMQWVDANPDKRLDSHLRRRFGITLEQYNAMAEAQGGVCAICGQPPTTYSTPGGRRRKGRMVQPRLVVDHDHGTGVIRGLLCSPCNRGIGFLGDSAAIVRAALNYLER